MRRSSCGAAESGDELNWSIPIVSSMTVLLLCWGLYETLTANRRRIVSRIRAYVHGPRTPGDSAFPEEPQIAADQVRSNRLYRFQLTRPLLLFIEHRLAQAHVLLKPEEFLSIKILCVVGMAGLLWLIAQNTAALVVGGAIGSTLPWIGVMSAKAKRQARIEQQFSDLLQILINALKSGHSFMQALHSVKDELAPPLSDEFAQLIRETSMGYPLEDALQRLSSRVGSEDLDLIITAALIQRRVGGNLAEVLEQISTTVKERVRLKVTLKTVTAQGRLSAIILSGLPIGFAAILALMDPKALAVLMYDPLGQIILLAAVLMEVTGIIFIRRIVNIRA